MAAVPSVISHVSGWSAMPHRDGAPDWREQRRISMHDGSPLQDEAVRAAGHALDVDGLGKRVALPSGELTILQDVGFRIGHGDTVAIVGASGSGKSTLLSLLAGLDTPSAGRVLLDGAPISTLDEDGRARVRGEKVGFVFQSFQLLPSLTALENVMLPLELRGDRDVEALAREVLQRVGLGERLGHYPRQLSGGEQQRVALARAFVTRPSLLFADEPTGNLDTATGQAIVDLLFALNADAGTTLVLVTHDDRLAARCARRLRIDSGRLVADEALAA
ncbi:ABC transporter ATP-binding protein [Luteimonas sp. TWI1437]|uniref:ABC transporter ATP-binding protein n=2 Tax=unclassified Luteimonas TaxID=2629088 RepID=UPI0032093310